MNQNDFTKSFGYDLAFLFPESFYINNHTNKNKLKKIPNFVWTTNNLNTI